MKGHQIIGHLLDEAERIRVGNDTERIAEAEAFIEVFKEKTLGDNVTQLVRVTLGSAHTLYTYRWTGSRTLRRGEKVIVPVADPDPDSTAEALCTAKVAAIGSSWTGPVKNIVRRQHPWEKDR